MRNILILLAVATLPAAAIGQLVGGVTGAVGGAVGATTETVDKSTHADPLSPVDHTDRAAGDAISGPAKSGVKVNAGARVARGERCYDGTDYYDPYYQDGYYYCERTGQTVAAKANVKPPR